MKHTWEKTDIGHTLVGPDCQRYTLVKPLGKQFWTLYLNGRYVRMFENLREGKQGVKELLEAAQRGTTTD